MYTYMYLQVCRKRIEDGCPKPTPALLRMRDHFDAPRDFRRKVFDIDGLPLETADQPQVSKLDLQYTTLCFIQFPLPALRASDECYY